MLLRWSFNDRGPIVGYEIEAHYRSSDGWVLAGRLLTPREYLPGFAKAVLAVEERTEGVPDEIWEAQRIPVRWIVVENHAEVTVRVVLQTRPKADIGALTFPKREWERVRTKLVLVGSVWGGAPIDTLTPQGDQDA